MTMKNTELEMYQLKQFFIDVFYKEVVLIVLLFLCALMVGSYIVVSRDVNYKTDGVIELKTSFVGDKTLFPWIKESSEYQSSYIKKVLLDKKLISKTLESTKSNLFKSQIIKNLKIKDYLDDSTPKQRVLGTIDKSKSSGSNSFSLSISLSGTNERDLPIVLMDLMKRFIEYENKETHFSLEKKLSIFKNQRAEITKKLAKLIEKKSALQNENNSLDIQAEMDSIIIFINKNMGVIERIDGELLVLMNREQAVQKELESRLGEDIDLALFDRSYGALRNTLLDLEAERAVLKDTYIDGHPKLRTIEARIKLLTQRANELNSNFNKGSGRMSLDPVARKLNTEVRELGYKIAATLQRKKSTLDLISKEKSNYKSLNEAQSKLSSIVELETDLRIEESTLTKLIEIGGLNLRTVFLDFEYVKEVSKAYKFNNQFKDWGPLLVLALALISVALALYTKYFFSGKFMRSSDVSKVLPQTIYGMITSSKVLDGNELVCTESKTPSAESFRKLRANLTFHFSDLKTITISSAERGDGKSFVSVNLATSLAMMGKKVLLIDGDVRLPRDHLIFGLENLLGFVDLMDDCALEDVIQKTKVSNLDFMSSGITSLNSADFLHSTRFDTIFSMLEELYDYVLFDTPPVAYATDAFIYAKKTSVSLFVLSIDKTKVVNVEKYLTELENLGIDNLGLVINRVSEAELFGARNYRYYY